MMQRLKCLLVFFWVHSFVSAQETTLLPTGKPVKSMYMVSRLSTMPGSSWQAGGGLVYGWGLLHSVGYQFNKVLGTGAGAGFELYGSGMPISFPVFAEIRTYLGKPQKVSPFAAWAGGWGFVNNGSNDGDEGEDVWKGGWMGKFQIGLLFGNHFTVHSGLSVQAMERQWTNVWNQGFGTDNLLMQRLEFGVGLSW